MTLSLDPTGDHFVLRSTKDDGSTATIPLSPMEVLTIADMAPTCRQMALTMLNPQPNRGTITPIASMDVANFQLEPEMLGEKLILLLQLGPTGSSTSALAFPNSLAERLAREIESRLAQIREQKSSRQ